MIRSVQIMLDKFRQVLHQVSEFPRYIKRMIVLFFDISFCILSVWVAFYLRLGEVASLNSQLFLVSTVSLAFALPVFSVFGLYRIIFRYSGFSVVAALTRAIGVYGLLFAAVVGGIGIVDVPRTVGLIQPLLLFFAIGGSRLLARYWFGSGFKAKLQVATLPKALIYGAGNVGCQLLSALSNSSEMRVVGFLDDDDRLHGHVLNGKFIFSPDDLGYLIKSKGVTHVLMAMPSASRRERNEALKRISGHHLMVRTLPNFADLVDGRVTTSDIHDLDIDDLLGREVVEPNHNLLTQNISGKVVLVTGAGGSIGSELCRQIIKLKPQRLILVEISEYALYTIHEELEGLGILDAKQIVPLLASAQDENRMRQIMNIWEIDTLYHAAAYKHVPLVEYNVTEGVKNNLLGTLTVAQIAIEKGVSHFVLISTDKAVRPTSVMGATKRLAEICLQALYAKQAEYCHQSQRFKPTSLTKTNLSIVRFGNVLDSSGSVIPRFRKQIRDGGPITLTHPEITRYFMTIPEAAQLVIQAGAMAKGGDVFVLSMGESVKIADLARSMIELSGLVVRDDANPDGDIEIVVTGLRPGEKLYEELMLGDDPQPTMHPRIQRAHDPFIPWGDLEEDLATLKILLTHNNVQALIEILKKLVAGYQPDGEIVDFIFSGEMQSVIATY